MKTKTQREFNKQMKQLEKEGKIPESYYPRRQRLKYTVSGGTILVALFFMWRFGVFDMIRGVSNGISSHITGEPPAQILYEEAYTDSDSIALEDYELSISSVPKLTLDIRSYAYSLIYNDFDIDYELLDSYKTKIEDSYEIIKTDLELLKPYERLNKASLDMNAKFIVFISEHKGEFSQEEVAEIESFIDKSQKLTSDIENLSYEIWDSVYY